jgi:hypothetical protein
MEDEFDKLRSAALHKAASSGTLDDIDKAASVDDLKRGEWAETISAPCGLAGLTGPHAATKRAGAATATSKARPRRKTAQGRLRTIRADVRINSADRVKSRTERIPARRITQ